LFVCIYKHVFACFFVLFFFPIPTFLTNTQAGIKEMGHQIFKGIVPKTNRKRY
jgi:hypothetical protein